MAPETEATGRPLVPAAQPQQLTALSGRCFVTLAALKLHLVGFGGKAEMEIIGSNDSFQGHSFE